MVTRMQHLHRRNDRLHVINFVKLQPGKTTEQECSSQPRAESNLPVTPLTHHLHSTQSRSHSRTMTATRGNPAAAYPGRSQDMDTPCRWVLVVHLPRQWVGKRADSRARSTRSEYGRYRDAAFKRMTTRRNLRLRILPRSAYSAVVGESFKSHCFQSLRMTEMEVEASARAEDDEFIQKQIELEQQAQLDEALKIRARKWQQKRVK